MLSLWQFLFIFSCFHLILSLSYHAVLFPDSHMIYGIRLYKCGMSSRSPSSLFVPTFARPRIILMSPSHLYPVTWVYTPTLLHSQCPYSFEHSVTDRRTKNLFSFEPGEAERRMKILFSFEHSFTDRRTKNLFSFEKFTILPP